MPSLLPADGAPSSSIGCDAPPLLQTSGALVRLCVPRSWRPLQDPLVLVAPEPSVEDDANSASERLLAAEKRIVARLRASGTTLPASWATAVTSLRASGLPALRTATDDLTDALFAFRTRRGPPSGVGLLGWGVGGLIATRALEASPPYGAACVVCAPIGSVAAQLEYLLDFSTLFELHFPGVLPAEATPVIDAHTAARIVSLLNGAPAKTLQLLRAGGVAADLLERNTSGTGPVGAALSVLREAQAWRAQQRAAFGGRAYSNLHVAYSTRGEGGVEEDGRLNAAVPREAAEAGAEAALRERFETQGDPPPPRPARASPLRPTLHVRPPPPHPTG